MNKKAKIDEDDDVEGRLRNIPSQKWITHQLNKTRVPR
jgi:hypothetical protein